MSRVYDGSTTVATFAHRMIKRNQGAHPHGIHQSDGRCFVHSVHITSKPMASTSSLRQAMLDQGLPRCGCIVDSTGGCSTLWPEQPEECCR